MKIKTIMDEWNWPFKHKGRLIYHDTIGKATNFAWKSKSKFAGWNLSTCFFVFSNRRNFDVTIITVTKRKKENVVRRFQFARRIIRPPISPRLYRAEYNLWILNGCFMKIEWLSSSMISSWGTTQSWRRNKNFVTTTRHVIADKAS